MATPSSSGAHGAHSVTPPSSGTAPGNATVVSDHTVEHHQPVAPVRRDDHHDDATTVRAASGDQVRWGPVWAGLIVALPTFLLLQLAFFALGVIDVGGGAGSDDGWISGIIGLVAFFLGGLVAGASSRWRSASSGLLNGIMVWALGVVALLFITLLGGGALFGALSSALGQAGTLQSAGANVTGPEFDSAVQTARSAASFALLGLGLTLAAAALGGLVGSKIWPRKKDTDEVVEVRQ